MALKSYKMYCFYHFLTEFTIFIILYRFIQYLYQWRKLNTYETMTQYKGDIDKTVRCIYQILSINLPFSILVDNIEGLCCLRVTDVKYKILFSGTCCSPESHLAKISRLSTSKIAQGSSQNGANHSKNKPLVKL